MEFRGPRDILSFTSGIISIMFWCICLVPQIVSNYKRPEQISPSIYAKVCNIYIPHMQLMWVLGDSLNLIGIFLVNGLPFQKITSILFVTMDLINFLQKFYYKNKISEYEEYISRDLEAGHVREPLLTRTNSIISKIILLFMCNTGSVSANEQEIFNIDFINENYTNVTSYSSDLGFNSDNSNKYIGLTLGICALSLYIGSRVVIIRKILKGTLENFDSSILFYAIFANFFYSLGLLIKDKNMHDFEVSVPWLSGSIITMFMDIFIVSHN